MAMGDNIREGGGNFEEAQLVRFFHDHDEGDEQHMHDNRENDVDEHEHQDEPIFPENDRFEPQFEPLEPVMNREEPVDMEMNVALDELLGLRGPFGALLRNLLWLLAFNVTSLLSKRVSFSPSLAIRTSISPSIFVKSKACIG